LKGSRPVAAAAAFVTIGMALVVVVVAEEMTKSLMSAVFPVLFAFFHIYRLSKRPFAL